MLKNYPGLPHVVMPNCGLGYHPILHNRHIIGTHGGMLPGSSTTYYPIYQLVQLDLHRLNSLLRTERRGLTRTRYRLPLHQAGLHE